MSFEEEEPAALGKTVLVGVTYYDSSGRELRRGQWWGKILAFNLKDGLRVDLSNKGEPHSFPPFLGILKPAKPGTYELRSTGEQIEDPDLVYTIRSDQSAS